MTPRYLALRQQFIAGEEGTRHYAYDDATGERVRPGEKPRGFITVGIGFNLDASGARDAMRAALRFNSETFDAIYSGQMPLTEADVARLFSYSVGTAEGMITQRLGGVMLTDEQRVALVSLAFNAPALIGPKLVAAVRGGDWHTVLTEVLYNSGAQRDGRLAKRRHREASMLVAGYVDVPPLTTYLAALEALPRFA